MQRNTTALGTSALSDLLQERAAVGCIPCLRYHPPHLTQKQYTTQQVMWHTDCAVPCRTAMKARKPQGLLGSAKFSGWHTGGRAAARAGAGSTGRSVGGGPAGSSPMGWRTAGRAPVAAPAAVSFAYHPLGAPPMNCQPPLLSLRAPSPTAGGVARPNQLRFPCPQASASHCPFQAGARRAKPPAEPIAFMATVLNTPSLRPCAPRWAGNRSFRAWTPASQQRAQSHTRGRC